MVNGQWGNNREELERRADGEWRMADGQTKSGWLIADGGWPGGHAE